MSTKNHSIVDNLISLAELVGERYELDHDANPLYAEKLAVALDNLDPEIQKDISILNETLTLFNDDPDAQHEVVSTIGQKVYEYYLMRKIHARWTAIHSLMS